MVCRIDLGCLIHWTVVQPQDHITFRIEIRPRHGDGFAGLIVEHGQRAGGIEADTPYGLWIDIVLANSPLHGCADTTPDVRGRLFLVTYIPSVHDRGAVGIEFLGENHT